MSNAVATIMLLASFITGAINTQECPAGAQWQWYENHGIWACGR